MVGSGQLPAWRVSGSFLTQGQAQRTSKEADLGGSALTSRAQQPVSIWPLPVLLAPAKVKEDSVPGPPIQGHLWRMVSRTADQASRTRGSAPGLMGKPCNTIRLVPSPINKGDQSEKCRHPNSPNCENKDSQHHFPGKYKSQSHRFTNMQNPEPCGCWGTAGKVWGRGVRVRTVMWSVPTGKVRGPEGTEALPEPARDTQGLLYLLCLRARTWAHPQGLNHNAR